MARSVPPSWRTYAPSLVTALSTVPGGAAEAFAPKPANESARQAVADRARIRMDVPPPRAGGLFPGRPRHAAPPPVSDTRARPDGNDSSGRIMRCQYHRRSPAVIGPVPATTPCGVGRSGTPQRVRIAGSGLQDYHRGLGRPPRRVAVQVRVDLAPAGPQPRPLVAGCGVTTHQPPTADEIDGRVRVRLQVEPPGGLTLTPPVHRQRDQVRTVLEVPDDDTALPAGA